MVTKEECEEMGMIYVEPHDNGKGGHTRGYCRKRSEKEKMQFPMKDSHFDILDNEDDIIEPLDIHEDEKEINMPTKEDLEGKSVKLPRSNLKNAKTILKDIKNEDGIISKDLHKQDFEDIPYQTERLEKDAEKEGGESEKLFESQRIKAINLYSNIKKKIAVREFRDRKKSIKNEKKAMRKNISAEKKRIRHEKRMKRKNDKLNKLQNKHGDE